MDLVNHWQPFRRPRRAGYRRRPSGPARPHGKPIEISTARADALIEAAKQSKVQLGVIFQDRRKPHIRQLKNWLDQGLPRQDSIRRRAREVVSPSRVLRWLALARHARARCGGALINQGVHTIDSAPLAAR